MSVVEGMLGDSQKFWMIVNVRDLIELRGRDGREVSEDYHLPEDRLAKYVHTDEDRAQRELLRLGSKYPGQFVLLEAVGRVEKREGSGTKAWFIKRFDTNSTNEHE